MAKKCKNCKKPFVPVYSTLEQYCEQRNCQIARINAINKKQKTKKEFIKIPQISKKRQVEQLKYSVLRIEFLGKSENKVCPITGLETTDVHHKKGRVGDLYLDTKYWVALSREGHKFVEENPIWAKENGYSLNRLSND